MIWGDIKQPRWQCDKDSAPFQKNQCVYLNIRLQLVSEKCVAHSIFFLCVWENTVQILKFKKVWQITN